MATKQCTLQGAFQFNVQGAKNYASRGTAEGDFAAAAMYYAAAMDAACLRQDHKGLLSLSRNSRAAYAKKVAVVTPAAAPVVEMSIKAAEEAAFEASGEDQTSMAQAIGNAASSALGKTGDAAKNASKAAIRAAAQALLSGKSPAEAARAAAAAAVGSVTGPAEGMSATGKVLAPGQWEDKLPATLQVDPEKGDNPAIKPLNPAKLGVTMEMVAGNARAKRLLREILINPFNFPQQYPDGIMIDGIMLYGVAGTGKTTITSAAAKSIVGYRTAEEVKALNENPEIAGFADHYFPDGKVPKVLFFPASVSDITSMYVGEPARKIRRFFQMARAAQPAVVFFDEGEEYLDPGNQHNSSTITTFKQEIGGIESKKIVRDSVVVILATNYPMRVEAAIRSRLGPGAIEISLPDFAARAKIAEINFKKGGWKTEQAAARQKMAGSELLAVAPTPLVQFPEDMASYIACQTLPPDAASKGRAPWSGRDIESLVKTAYLANRSRVLGGFVQECTSNCIYYKGKTFGKAYQEVDLKAVNAALGKAYTSIDQVPGTDRSALAAKGIVAIDTLDQQNQFRVLASPLGLEDIQEAFRRMNSTVDKGAIRDQFQYNQELGEVVAQQGFWQLLYQDPEKPTPLLLGKNTTVPDPDGAPSNCAEIITRLEQAKK